MKLSILSSLFAVLATVSICRADDGLSRLFGGARAFAAPDFPSGLVLIDANDDGHLDVVTVELGEFFPDGSISRGGVLIAWGQGNGTFAEPSRFLENRSITGLIAADLNQDRKPDFILATASGVIIVLGPDWSRTRTCLAGCPVHCVGVADFNSDGFPDLAVSLPDGLAILSGTGDGVFGDPRYITELSGSFVSSDLNGDGQADLAISDGVSAVTALLGSGDGVNFMRTGPFPVGIQPQRLVVSDLNRDRKADLIVSNAGSWDGTSFSDGGISILFGNGDGTFQSQVKYEDGESTGGVAVGDVNRDGLPDLVAANILTGLTILLGRTDGTFVKSATYQDGYRFNLVAIGDYNEDSLSDLVFVSAGPGVSSFSIIAGRGDGTFQAAPAYPVSPVGVSGLKAFLPSLLAGDMNRDGILDLLVLNATVDQWSVEILPGIGNGSFGLPIIFPLQNDAASGIPQSIAAGDFNRDGKLDVAVVSDGTRDSLRILLGEGDGTLQSGATYPAEAPLCVTPADFNGDSNLDLAVGTDRGIALYLGAGNGRFSEGWNIDLNSNVRSLSVGDLDRDGKLDLAAALGPATDYENLRLLHGRGDGTFELLNSETLRSGANHVAISDLNLDGTPDLLVTPWFGDGGGAAFLGKDGTNFADPVTFTSFSNASGIVIEDFDGDGKPDLAMSDVDFHGTISFAVGAGDGSFKPSGEYLSGLACFSIVGGDFNRDGALDLAAATPSGVAVLMNTCGPRLPELTVVRLSSGLRLTWPDSSGAYLLESAESLSDAHWTGFPNEPSVIRGQAELTVRTDSKQRFFRLRAR